MKKLTIFFAFLLFAGFTVQAQMQISGTVTGAEDGLSIPGVSVLVKDNPTIGTTTDIDGKYSLTVPSSAEAIVFSFVGMKEIQVTQHEIQEVMKKRIHRNKKKYYKKTKHKNKTDSVIDYKDSANITHAELWELQCDILLPAAIGEGICAGGEELRLQAHADYF